MTLNEIERRRKKPQKYRKGDVPQKECVIVPVLKAMSHIWRIEDILVTPGSSYADSVTASLHYVYVHNRI